MHCPFCAALDTKVIDSRLAEDGGAVRRRRRCPECNERFTTFERMEEVQLMVVKSTGEKQPFDRAKIVAGVASAAKGRLDAERIESVAVDVEDQMRLTGPEVTSSEVGLAVLDALAELDHVAYLRFASVYKGFDGIDDFHRELGELAKRPAPEPSI